MLVIPYQPRWTDEFSQIARRIRDLTGRAAIRIDHIGSTAVPGLGAKDVIDVQITVSDLDEAGRLTTPLRAAGFRHGATFEYDVFHTKPETDPELRKLYMREPEGERRAHIHVRELGRFNQRYALLFRDYLRSAEGVRAEYELLKRQASRLFPDSIDGYLRLKDPVLHIIYEAASLWAEKVGWGPDEDYG
ncbi:MAG TPA: GrpB family protein [Methylomirabilota bacterium]|nr:GrpB family protein [Methylomirabilota bacterium]